MKVLHLLSTLKHDDDERGIYAISHALTHSGNACTVIASTPPDNAFALRLIHHGVHYRQLALQKKSWSGFFRVFALAKLIKVEQPDIIHVHSRTPAWMLKWAIKKLRARYPTLKIPKIVGGVYGFYSPSPYSRALLGHSDQLIAASSTVKDYLAKLNNSDNYPIAPFVCVARGVDVNRYPYRHKSSLQWLTHIFSEYPELEHKKWLIFPTPLGIGFGQEWLIDLLGNLNKLYPNLHLIIMDDPKPETVSISYEDFYQRAHALNLRAHITFVGRAPTDLKDWLSSADIVLALSGYSESIGMTAIKALHLGTPVVGFAQGAFGDVLMEWFENGLVKDRTANALCNKVSWLLDTKLRPPMRHLYEEREMVEKTLAVYQSLLPAHNLW